jgi:hypothetical protein
MGLCLFGVSKMHNVDVNFYNLKHMASEASKTIFSVGIGKLVG